MKLETLEIGTKLKVVKDIYYVSDGRSVDNEYLTKEELFEQVSHLCVVGDIWEVIEDDGEKWLQCISGEWKDEINDGWFEDEDMIEKGAFEILTEQ
jgi:hypothetical protein